MLVIDLFGLSEADVRERFPEVYQHLLLTVKPERDQNNRASYRQNWWIFGEPRSAFRPALEGLPRYIATVETSKHRFFQFLDASVLPDNMLVAVAHDDAYVLGVLSSRIHVLWALAQGGDLRPTPRYNKTRCFETFPFPAATEAQQQAIREKAQELDDHRKSRLSLHPDLGMTALYNVVEKLRAGALLTDAERDVHDRGLVSTLRSPHDELDVRVAEAYSWPADLPEQEVLGRLLALNGQREAEERQDLVRYLRPAYQDPRGTAAQLALGLEVPEGVAAQTIPAFPSRLAEQSQAVRLLLRGAARPLTARQVAGSFKGLGEARAEELLETLAVLGQAREVAGQAGYTA